LSPATLIKLLIIELGKLFFKIMHYCYRYLKVTRKNYFVTFFVIMQNEMSFTDLDEIKIIWCVFTRNERTDRKMSVVLSGKLRLMVKIDYYWGKKFVLISSKLMNKFIFCIITLFKMLKQVSKTKYK